MSVEKGGRRSPSNMKACRQPLQYRTWENSP